MKTIIIGLDAFDPNRFEELHEQGKTPNLSKFVESNSYSRFEISNPAQSEVSWTSIATGLNPGGHGMFDFVHRNPKNYGITVSLLPTKKTMVGMQFIPPHSAETIFDHAVERGYPATSLWPATFPARLTSPVHSIPGLGTPDIGGKLGVGILYSAYDLGDDAPAKTEIRKLIHGTPKDTFTGILEGPGKQKGETVEPSTIDFSLTLDNKGSADFKLGKKISLTLQEGKWSPVIEISFKMTFLISLKAVTRVLLLNGVKGPLLYFLPLQIHPMSSAWPYASPRNFIKKTWSESGPFLTLGWPQDTTGLNEGIISEDQFLNLCDSILTTRETVFISQLNNYKEGVLGIVFDTLDRVQHMFWKDRPDIIEQWYLKLDALVGRIQGQIATSGNQDAQILIMSDHGFSNFNYKFHLNKFLIDEGFLKLKDQNTQSLNSADWQESTAYGIGLNSLYLNLAGREGQGILPGDKKAEEIERIKTKLLELKGPDNNPVISSVQTNDEAFEGPLAHLGPDLVIGYASGYRASAETGTGNWNQDAIEENKDHWNADHCIDPAHVPGVLFRNKGLEDFSSPSYRDIPQMVVGKSMKPGSPPDSDDYSDEDQETVEDRLKGLGYL
jgi:predicted AlkP superfamily phosphohydrolase/phosphomutase